MKEWRFTFVNSIIKFVAADIYAYEVLSIQDIIIFIWNLTRLV